MDGMLSQDEINALLNGMSDDTPAGSAESSSAENTADSTSAGPELLSDVEKDAVVKYRILVWEQQLQHYIPL